MITFSPLIKFTTVDNNTILENTLEDVILDETHELVLVFKDFFDSFDSIHEIFPFTKLYNVMFYFKDGVLDCIFCDFKKGGLVIPKRLIFVKNDFQKDHIDHIDHYEDLSRFDPLKKVVRNFNVNKILELRFHN